METPGVIKTTSLDRAKYGWDYRSLHLSELPHQLTLYML